jgi:hypothetical protein
VDSASTLEAVDAQTQDAGAPPADTDWVTIVAPGEMAILVNVAGTQEVEIVGYRYTPRGLLYELRHKSARVAWTVPADTVQPIYGETKLIRVNLVTDETIELM